MNRDWRLILFDLAMNTIAQSRFAKSDAFRVEAGVLYTAGDSNFGHGCPTCPISKAPISIRRFERPPRRKAPLFDRALSRLGAARGFVPDLFVSDTFYQM